MIIKPKLIILIGATAALLFFGLTTSHATVETGWPAGTPNTCQDSADGFMDFELGVEEAEIESTIPGLEFTTTYGLNWSYGDIRSGNYHVNPYGDQTYETNGNFFAWLGITGDEGRITFTGGTANYLSILVSTSSGVTIDAYDVDGIFLATSGLAPDNRSTGTLTRLTVEAVEMAYVNVHDTGNYWIIDDLCTDAPPPCQPVPGRTLGDENDRINLVFVPDEDYNGNMTDFLNDVDDRIDNRLLHYEPISSNADRFNFYYSELEGNVTSSNCGKLSSLPDDFLSLCPEADAVVVLHKAGFTDCKRSSGNVGIFSAEGNIDRSFIHEGGHGIFGLKDEYDSNRSNSSCEYTSYNTDRPMPSNIWDTEDNCRADAEDQGWDPDECFEFTPCQSDWWKLGDPELATDDDKYYDEDFQYIMKDGYDFAKGWGEASERRLVWFFDNIPATPEAPSPSPSGEKAIILKLNISDSGLILLEKGFVAGPTPKYLPGDYSFAAKVYYDPGYIQGEYGFEDPRIAQVEDGGSGSYALESADFTVKLPYFDHVGFAEIVDKLGNPLLTVDLSAFASAINAPPVCDADGPYVEECQGAETSIALDGSGTSDPDGDPMTYIWSTDCPGGTFDDETMYNPELTLDSPDTSIPVNCVANLIVEDPNGTSDSCLSEITVVDTTPPDIVCPADITIECDEETNPDNTGIATATDICSAAVAITFSDVVTPGACSEETITRTWTATDYSGNQSSCVQTINVVDTTAPLISCNSPATITPSDATVAYTATVEDNCDEDPLYEITNYTCAFTTNKGKVINRDQSCIVSFDGDTLTIDDVGGINNTITWTVEAVDCTGNQATEVCSTNVVKYKKP